MFSLKRNPRWPFWVVAMCCILSSILCHGHLPTLNWWKAIWNLFIKKELVNPDLNKLWCFMIFKADWQLLLKWHSSYGFLPKSETVHTLTPAQGGCHKGHSTIGMQQNIKMELIKLNQWPAIDLFLEAHHCFNLMVEACHNMTCHQHGTVDNYLWLHAQTHHLMKCYVCHKYGISKDYNTFDQHPWHGAGQGAADAALQYIVLSDTLSMHAIPKLPHKWCMTPWLSQIFNEA